MISSSVNVGCFLLSKSYSRSKIWTPLNTMSNIMSLWTTLHLTNYDICLKGQKLVILSHSGRILFTPSMRWDLEQPFLPNLCTPPTNTLTHLFHGEYPAILSQVSEKRIEASWAMWATTQIDGMTYNCLGNNKWSCKARWPEDDLCRLAEEGHSTQDSQWDQALDVGAWSDVIQARDLTLVVCCAMLYKSQTCLCDCTHK